LGHANKGTNAIKILKMEILTPFLLVASARDVISKARRIYTAAKARL